MISRRRGRFLVLLVCAWFYGTLLFLYPKSFRLRYSAELRRDFFGLSREALRDGGIPGVVRVWAHAFSALALTGIRQRRITLPMERRVASAMVMMLQVAVVAAIVAMVSIWQAPTNEAPVATKQPGNTYKATGMIWLTEKPNTTRVRVSNPRGAGYFIKPPGRPEKIEVIKNATHTPSVAKEVIRRLDLQMKPAELLDNLAIETKEYVDEPIPKDFASHGCCYLKSTSVDLIYKNTDREKAKRVLNMVGQVAFESSDRIGYSKSLVAKSPAIPASPPPPSNALRNGLLTLAMGLALCFLLKRREFKYALSNRGAIRDATYYLWETRYAYYLSLSQTASAKVTTAVGFLITLVLSIASMVGGGGSKPAPFD